MLTAKGDQDTWPLGEVGRKAGGKSSAREAPAFFPRCLPQPRPEGGRHVKFNRRQRFAVYGGLFMSTAAFMALVNGGSVGALTTPPTSGAVVAADPTSSTAATATTASTASTTSTTAGPTTTTTVGYTADDDLRQVERHQQVHSRARSGPAAADPTARRAISISASAFPQPHKGRADQADQDEP